MTAVTRFYPRAIGMFHVDDDFGRWAAGSLMSRSRFSFFQEGDR